jgi:hypothetical protein
MNFNVNNEKYVYILYGSFFSRLHSASHKSDFITYQGTIPLPTRLLVDKTQQTTIAWSCALYDVEHKSAQFCWTSAHVKLLFSNKQSSHTERTLEINYTITLKMFYG